MLGAVGEWAVRTGQLRPCALARDAPLLEDDDVVGGASGDGVMGAEDDGAGTAHVGDCREHDVTVVRIEVRSRFIEQQNGRLGR